MEKPSHQLSIISLGQERQAQTQQLSRLPITARIVMILDLTIYEQDIMIVREVLSEPRIATQMRTQILSARTVTAMCRIIPSTTPTRVGTSGTVSKKAGTMLKRRPLMHGMVKNILMEEINNEYKSNSFKKKKTF